MWTHYSVPSQNVVDEFSPSADGHHIAAHGPAGRDGSARLTLTPSPLLLPNRERGDEAGKEPQSHSRQEPVGAEMGQRPCLIDQYSFAAMNTIVLGAGSRCPTYSPCPDLATSKLPAVIALPACMRCWPWVGYTRRNRNCKPSRPRWYWPHWWWKSNTRPR